ncbi:MAG: Helicase associated domain protein, partial [Acidimicrobiia bacterium]
AAVDAETFARVAAHPDLAGIDAHLLAGAIAVVRAMGQFRLASCLSFHTRVERARTFASLVGPVADALAGERPPGPGWAGWAHGGASVRIRQRLLSRLADGASWGVLANARAFGEGVDLPTLDAVAIVDPKNSEADVLQAAGRALRRPSEGSKVGTVVLPVLLAAGADADDPLGGIDGAGLEVVAGVLRALRAHDDGLGARLDLTRRRVGSRPGGRPDWAAFARRSAAQGLLRSRVELWVPGGATGELAGAMALRLVREAAPGWEEHFGRLRAWATEHGSAAVPQLATVADGRGGTFGLGAWCTTQRTLRRRQLLGPERVSALEALPGWTWDPVPEQWLANLDALADWARRHGHANCPQATVWRGRRIGTWANTVRTAHKAGLVDAGRVAALEAVPGWSWDVRGDAWEEHFAALAGWAAEHGHACPSSGDLVAGFDLGRWVAKQRSALRSGRLEATRAERLRALPGWVDHEREAGWEAGYARLRAWAAEHGHAAPPQTLVLDDGYGLGSWVATQRERRRQGRLPEARRDRLDALRGWEWSPRNDAWPAAYARLVAFVERHGHARVPDGADADGFCLGAWATAQRTQHRRGTLSAERVAALEALPGWVWSIHGARLDAAVAALEAFAARHGHCEPGPDQGEEGRRLAGWVVRARAQHGEGRLEAARAQRLEAIAGWRWDAPMDREAAWAAAWETNLAALLRWTPASGGALPRQGDVDDDGVRIGAWVAKQRSKHRAGRLGPDRASRLEALPGWAW